MILYLDTSSLVKTYLEEAHSPWVRDRVREADVLATSVVAYPEALAAVARRTREGDLTDQQQARVIGAIDGDWARLLRIAVEEKRAGELALGYTLRGFDAIHLAAALEVREAGGEAAAFSSFDRKLNSAARAEGLLVMAPEEFLP